MPHNCEVLSGYFGSARLGRRSRLANRDRMGESGRLEWIALMSILRGRKAGGLSPFHDPVVPAATRSKRTCLVALPL